MFDRTGVRPRIHPRDIRVIRRLFPARRRIRARVGAIVRLANPLDRNKNAEMVLVIPIRAGLVGNLVIGYRPVKVGQNRVGVAVRHCDIPARLVSVIVVRDRPFDGGSDPHL